MINGDNNITQTVHYRTGSLENKVNGEWKDKTVHYRTGSLEIGAGYETKVWIVHYRTGSLEKTQ